MTIFGLFKNLILGVYSALQGISNGFVQMYCSEASTILHKACKILPSFDLCRILQAHYVCCVGP